MKLLWGKRDEPETSIPSHLATVLNSEWVAEYRGKVAHNPSGKYHLYCDRIGEVEKQALLAEGFRGVGQSKEPTHFAICTVTLNRDAGNPRVLFNFFLCLSEVGDRLDQDLVALAIARGLRARLRDCKDLGFLIRCKDSKEFDWCLDDEHLTSDWLAEAGAHYRATLKILERLRQI